MMNKKFMLLIVSTGLLSYSAFAVPSAGSLKCANVYAKRLTPRQQEMTSWRLSPNKKENNDYLTMTLANQSGQVSKTSEARERELKDYALSVKKEVLVNDIAAIGMEFLPEVGQHVEYLEQSGEYGSHKTPLIQASHLGETGVLRGTLALPVSGRYGRETTMKWATTDLFTVEYINNGQRSALIAGAPSQNVITAQEIEIPLIKGQVIEIRYNRHGSAGPMGFPEGRILRISWDGT